MAMVMSASFLFAWTPYSIVAFMYYLHHYETVPLGLAAAAPYMAKSSTIYNPLIYFLAVKRFRQDVTEVFRGIFASNSVASSHMGNGGGTQISKMSSAEAKNKESAERELEEDIEENYDEHEAETLQLTAYHSKIEDNESNTRLLSGRIP